MLSLFLGRERAPIFFCPQTLVLLDVWPLNLDQDFTIGSSGSQAFRFELEIHPQLSWASNLQADHGNCLQTM